MNNKTTQNTTSTDGDTVMRYKKTRLSAALIAGVLALAGNPAQAFEFTNGDLSGSLDTTLSYGASWRVTGRDDDNIAKARFNPAAFTLSPAEQALVPGRFSGNGDDGNLNYDTGDLISHAVKITSELDLRWRNYGAFIRGTAFYDFENEDNDALTEVARDQFVGSRARLLDAYVYGNWDLNGRNASMRLGRQVVSWGESTFIQGGINVVNPVDVSKLRIAGAELKEAFLPIEMVWGSLDLSDSISVEALYMFEFEQIDPDPVGTYFATNDFATPGGAFAMLGFGTFPQPVNNPDLFSSVCSPQNRALLAAGGAGANLGDTGLPASLVSAGCAVAFPRAEDRYPSESGQYGVALRWYSPKLWDTEFGFYYLNYHSRLPLISGIAVTNADLASGRYFVEYPDDIELFGLSFNTTIGTWAWQGELSYRDNVPLQFDDVELLFSGLTPLNGAIAEPVDRFVSQLGDVGFGEEIRGWERHEVSQFQATTTKLFGPNNPFGANQIVFLAEFGFQKVWDLPDKDVLRYNGPGTDTGGGPDFTSGNFRNPLTLNEGFADDFSWGYRVVSRFDYNNAFGTSFTLSPRIGFNHDVDGTSPGPGGNFVDGRKSVTLGIGLNYLDKWVVDLAYTNFFDGGNFNELRDRDFMSASVRYSF